MNTTNGFMSYPEAAMAFEVSTRTLSRLVAAGKLTRYRSTRDHRRVLLNVAELHNHFSQLTTPNAA